MKNKFLLNGEYDSLDCFYAEMIEELRKAEIKHPYYVDDIIHAAGVLIEEAGEAMRAALNVYYEKENIEELKKELCQTGAMVFKFLLYIKRKEEERNNVISYRL